jgi:hypothetical protein
VPETVDLYGLTKDDFIDGLERPLGAASFIDMLPTPTSRCSSNRHHKHTAQGKNQARPSREGLIFPVPEGL